MIFKTIICYLCLCSISFEGKCQNLEIAPSVCDSISTNDYFIHVSGYATFTDVMELYVELIPADTALAAIYSASKDFSSNGVSTLANFQYDPVTEDFSLDIGNYSSNEYVIKIWSKINGELKEELLIDTF